MQRRLSFNQGYVRPYIRLGYPLYQGKQIKCVHTVVDVLTVCTRVSETRLSLMILGSKRNSASSAQALEQRTSSLLLHRFMRGHRIIQIHANCVLWILRRCMYAPVLDEGGTLVVWVIRH